MLRSIVAAEDPDSNGRNSYRIRYNAYGSHADTDGEAPPLGWLIQEGLAGVSERCSDDFGYALSVVQYGGMPPSAKAWRGEGPGVFELAEEYRGDAFRAVYTVRFEKAVYVLHCFQKKSPSGVRTARQDVNLIHERLKAAQEDYEVRYGKEED